MGPVTFDSRNGMGSPRRERSMWGSPTRPQTMDAIVRARGTEGTWGGLARRGRGALHLLAGSGEGREDWIQPKGVQLPRSQP